MSVTGWSAPSRGRRPGRVTSTCAAARWPASAAARSRSSSSARPLSTRCFRRLTASPYALRSAGGTSLIESSSARTAPCLRPIHSTRSASQAARSRTAAQAAAKRSPSASIRETELAPPGASPSSRTGRGRSLGLRLERLLGGRGEPGEGLRLAPRQIGQDLAVEAGAGLAQALDQPVVGQAVEPRRRVDAQDPQAAEVALALLAVAVGVGHGLVHGLLGHAVGVLLGAVVALGRLEDLLALLSLLVAALDTRHRRTSFLPRADPVRSGQWGRERRSAISAISRWGPRRTGSFRRQPRWFRTAASS